MNDTGHLANTLWHAFTINDVDAFLRALPPFANASVRDRDDMEEVLYHIVIVNGDTWSDAQKIPFIRALVETAGVPLNSDVQKTRTSLLFATPGCSLPVLDVLLALGLDPLTATNPVRAGQDIFHTIDDALHLTAECDRYSKRSNHLRQVRQRLWEAATSQRNPQS